MRRLKASSWPSWSSCSRRPPVRNRHLERLSCQRVIKLETPATTPQSCALCRSITGARCNNPSIEPACVCVLPGGWCLSGGEPGASPLGSGVLTVHVETQGTKPPASAYVEQQGSLGTWQVARLPCVAGSNVDRRLNWVPSLVILILTLAWLATASVAVASVLDADSCTCHADCQDHCDDVCNFCADGCLCCAAPAISARTRPQPNGEVRSPGADPEAHRAALPSQGSAIVSTTGSVGFSTDSAPPPRPITRSAGAPRAPPHESIALL